MSDDLREPRLYRGVVMHDRVRPARNRFRYGIYFLYVSIDELDSTAARVRLLSHNGPHVFSVWDRDHGPRDGTPLRPWIDDLLHQAGVDIAGGPIMLLTFPRVLGARFFPISIWYCFHPDGTARAILPEVHNTFRGHHNYLLHKGGEPLDWSEHPSVRKAFHVSPFIPMDAEYRFTFSEPTERLRVWIDDIVEGSHLLLAGVDLQARPLRDGELVKALLRFGSMSARALALIHWQAVKLVFKRVGFYHIPPPPEEETTL
jgi:DUF1365 family protein